MKLTDSQELGRLQATFTCESPNTNLEKVNGTLYTNPSDLSEKSPVSNEQMLLRGCILRNSKYVNGIVVYAGKDTKQMQNAGPIKHKRTQIDYMMNDLIINIFMILITMCAIAAVTNSIWVNSFDGYEFNVDFNYYDYTTANTTSYTDLGTLKSDNKAFISFLSFWIYFILISQLVPISLYVSVEFIRLGQSLMINWDASMYHEDTNTPAQARTTTLNEELGQIDYVFSDKTGTLTQNVMTFHSCTIAGISYEPDPLESDSIGRELLEAVAAGNARVLDFFKMLAVCHTCQSEVNSDGSLTYQAQSPDEKALVEGAVDVGVKFINDKLNKVTIERNGVTEIYKRLHVLEFDSTRKRMSTIVKCPDGRIFVYSKGADSIMFLRLNKESANAEKATMVDHLDAYAATGLRTLVFAQKELTQEEYESWAKRYHHAETSPGDNRDALVEALQDEIERNLVLVGASAIEDKLQDGVPETIAKIKEAGIKLFVLTGDKQETAINIGYSCELLTRDMAPPIIVNGDDARTVQSVLSAASRNIDSEYGTGLKYGMVIDGPTLTHVLPPSANELEDTHPDGSLVWSKDAMYDQDSCAKVFMEVANKCTSIICCRVSPLQKAKVVRMVKKREAAVTLAIGDGANDVSMIRAAHIGVGISGLEGRQAVLASDYSIAQFRFLGRLLLVHGRWSYMRICIFLRYFFYKSAAFSVVHLLYAFSCGGSGQTIFDPIYISMYNVVFTFFPIMIVGVLEQDVTATSSMRFPILYAAGPRDEYFNMKMFFHSFIRGGFHAIILFYGLYISIVNGGAYDSSGHAQNDLFTFAMNIAAALTIIANLQLAMEIRYWMWLVPLSLAVGPLGWAFIMGVQYQWDQWLDWEYVSPYYDTFNRSLGSSVFWQYLFFCIVLCTLPELLFFTYKTYFYPTPVDIVREFELLKDPSGVSKMFRKSSVAYVQGIANKMNAKERADEAKEREDASNRRSIRMSTIRSTTARQVPLQMPNDTQRQSM